MARLVFMGRPMAILERFDVHTWAALVREHRPNVMGAPPPVVQMILDAGITPDHFDGVAAFMTSSAAIPPATIRRFEERYGIPVLLGYGATEFLNSVTGWTPELWSAYGPTKVGSVGRALPHVRLRVIDPESRCELPAGEEGILEVDPPQRAGHLPAGWLRTTDRARLDADGFLWILGRADDVIVRGGFKVDLTSVEAALREHPAVAAAAVVGLPDERLGHVPGALVVLAEGDAADAAELLEWVRERVPPYAVPTVIQFADSIPQTPTFKPHRAEIERLLRPVG
jgi:acyl-coenzyme A synthetase/AMP-(fatty) acid ligase